MMKKLINFFKKLFRCEASCPKCKSNPCKCEPEIPVEHTSRVEEIPVKEAGSKSDYLAEFPVNKTEAMEYKTSEEKPASTKKKRAPRKKKSETSKK